MNVVELLRRLKDNNINLGLTGDDIEVSYDGEDLPAIFYNEISDYKSEIVDFLKKGHSKDNVFKSPGARPRRIPLSFSQERLWFVDQLEGSVQYHMPAILRLKGGLDTEALAYALQQMVRRHEPLRTVIRQQDGEVSQELLTPDGWRLRRREIGQIEPQALDQQIEELIVSPFDLSKDYMLRADLLALDDGEYILVVTVHHIASDGWSLSIIVRELVEMYAAYIEGREALLPALPVQYADYAIWQRKYLSGEVLEKKLDYWRRQLEGVSALELPTDHVRPLTVSTRGATLVYHIDKELVDLLRTLSQRQGVSLFMTLLAGFKALLYRYSGQRDICVGSPIAGRQQQETEGLVGFFINTLALRSDLSGDPTIAQLLQQVRETTLSAYEHQDVPFEKIVEVVVKERDISRHPLFQVMFALQNIPEVPELRLGETELSSEKYGYTVVKFDLTFFIAETPEGLRIGIVYRTDLFEEETMRRMGGHYEQLLRSIVADPYKKVGELEMLTLGERFELLEEFSGDGVVYEKGRTVVELFGEQALRSPEAVAVVYEGYSLSYGELDRRSNQVGRYLRGQGVVVGTLVPLCMERSWEMVVGILGIMKAGGAYVPVDPAYPGERIRYMVEDSGGEIVLSSGGSFSLPDGLSGIRVIDVARDWAEIGQESSLPMEVGGGSEQLAYVIYTSGSTGRPKGVMISHGNLVDYVYGLRGRLEIGEGYRYGMVTTVSTDLGNTVLYSALLSGGSLHVMSGEVTGDGQLARSYVDRYGIEVLKITPSHWRALSEGGELLLPCRLLIFGGEPLPVELVEELWRVGAGCRVVNHYGPTETTVGKLLHEVIRGRVYGGRIPVGRPFSDTRVYVLDENRELCAVGVWGELYIGGAGVGHGYWGRGELTLERFIADMFSKEGGGRLYRTGDRVRWNRDGDIEFGGRVDEQVKVRGYRIEPGEVESAMMESGLVRQGVVLVREKEGGDRRLVGYVVGGAGYDREVLMEYMRGRLPEYMVPVVIVELEELPLMGNGKVDRKRLPEAEGGLGVRGGYIGPRTDRERVVAGIWERLLEVERVGMADDFFELGGHSLLAIRMIAAIRKELGVEVPVGDIFDHPTIGGLVGQLEVRLGVERLPEIEVEERPAKVPLSFSQERLWFIDQLEGSVQYHVPAVLRLKGELDREALGYALRQVVNRHEVLRTVIRQEGGEAWQEVQEKDGWRLGEVEPGRYEEGTEALQGYIGGLIAKPFDLSRDPMLRADLIPLKEQDYILVVTLHHIASDGWSLSIIVGELVEWYGSYVEGREAVLPVLPMQYADYALWQRKYLSGERLEKKLSYWREKLLGVGALQLPTDRVRPGITSTRGAAVGYHIDEGLSGRLRALSQEQGVTLFMTLLSVFKVLLHRYSGQDDICVGSGIAGRQQQEVEGLVGFFINTLALRSDLGGDPTFVSLLQQVKETTLGAYTHQEVPFEKVVETVVKERDMSRHPLFQVTFVLHNTPKVPELRWNKVQLSVEGNEHTTTKIDINISLTDGPEGLDMSIEYSTDLYEEGTIMRMLGHYEQLLRSVVEGPGCRIGELRLLPEREERLLLEAFNATAVEYPKDKTVVDLFEEQASRTPDAVAVVYEERGLTYRELDERSSQLGHYLRRRGVGVEELVPVCIERSLEMIVGILGILKAGGAYVPIDPGYPADRIGYMLEDTGAKMVLSNGDSRHRLGDWSGGEVIDLDEDWASIGLEAKTGLSRLAGSEHLVYVIYTSGSTGRPKGVMIEHRGLTNLCLSQSESFGLKPGGRTIQFASFGFDASCSEIFNSIITGGCLVLPERQDILSMDRLGRCINEYKVELATLPPSYQSVVKEVLDTIKTIVSAGEPLNKDVGKYIQSKGIRLINAYGPTENTVCVSLTDDPIREHNVVIGKPIANVQVYILDKYGNISPIGVTGEICITGAQLARGYLNLPALTTERFVANPFSGEEGARLYRTGDMGRWLPDGNIEYLGRIDEQVKVRGYRIELGEIESVLMESGLVRQAVVVAQDEEGGNKRLAGFVVPKEDFDRKQVLSYLKSRLPEYMVPSMLMELEVLPLTPSGKIDRKILQHTNGDLGTADAYTGPRNDTERGLVKIWEELLEVQQVGIFDDFFELGGHSLLGIRLIGAIRKELGVELPVGDIFDYPTIAGLSGQMEARMGNERLPEIRVEERPVKVPLSFSQERLWFIDQLEGSVHYHIPTVLRLQGDLDTDALSYALREVVNRHEVLRTVIRQQEGKAWQEVLEKDSLRVGMSDWNTEEGILLEEYIRALIAAPFDLSGDHMLRADLLRLAERDYILVVTLHHIASDGWSLSIIVRELVELYGGYVEGREALLPVLPLQYADYAIWQRKYLTEEVLEGKLSYWREKLGGVAPLQLPADHARPVVPGTRGAALSGHIDRELTESLRALSQEQGATLFMTLLAVFKVLLYRYSGQEDICVGSPIAGRQQQEVEGLVGFFINTLALRSDLGGEPTFVRLLQQVKETTVAAYAHQDVPFEKVVETVVKERDMSRSPLFQVMFILQNTPEVPALRLGSVALSSETTGHSSVKFDLTIFVVEADGGLKLGIEYRKDLFEEGTIRQMMGHYEELLRSVVAEPGRAIGLLRMLGEAEERQVLEQFNGTRVDYPRDRTVVDLFVEQAVRTPDAIAVVFEEEELSYRELDARSNQLGHYLRSLGVREEVLVPICIERSLEMIVGILGILKAGGAYVPIDPTYPEERIAYMLEDTGGKVVLSSAGCRPVLGERSGVTVIELDSDWVEIGQESSTRMEVRPSAEHLAYVIYTSGSTGRPKGVQVEHGGLTNRLLWAVEYFGFDERDKVLQKTNYGFDVSVWELLCPLLSGGQLVFARPEGQKDQGYLQGLIEGRGITVVHFVPSMLEVFLSDIKAGECASLRAVVCSGEALKPLQAQQCGQRLPGAGLYNLYGPTEATIDVSYWMMPLGMALPVRVPIGRPVWNTTLYVLDGQRQLLPVGVVGELWIGGAQLARGYLNRPELTGERFIADPFSKEEGARLYRTGDLARWLPDGNIEYMGRIDDQVKIRGYRIELGEIESVVLESGLASQCVVLAKEDERGTKRLVGYVVAEGVFDRESMISYVKGRLPEYMVPGIWVELEALPLTSNGKVDRRSLPDPSRGPAMDNTGPRNETERILTKIWEELLGVEGIGIDDNFFELGGDSIITIQVVSLARRSGYELQPRDLFVRQTIAGLAGIVAERQASGIQVQGEQGVLTGQSGLLPIQQWYFEKAQTSYDHFNQSVLLGIDKKMGLKEVEAVVAALLEQHDALRFRYEHTAEGWQQEYAPYSGVAGGAVVMKDLRGTEKADLGKVIHEISDRYQRSLDIGKGELLRVVWMPTPASEENNRLLVVIHHLVVDGVSWRILLEDLEELLKAMDRKDAQGARLGRKGSSYRQWYEGLSEYGKSRRLMLQKDYWEEVSKGYAALPVDREYREGVGAGEMGIEQVRLGEEWTRRLLQEVPRVYHTEINDVLLAALARVLCGWTGRKGIVIGLEGHGRETIDATIDTSRTVGWYTSLYPVLLEVTGEGDAGGLLKGVKEQLRQVPDKGLGYGVLKYINKEEGLQGEDLWDVVFNYWGQLDKVMKEEGYLRGAGEPTGRGVGAHYIMREKHSVNSMVIGGELVVGWSYSSRHYDGSTIRVLAEEYIRVLEELIAHCLEQGRKGNVHTPSDYGLASAITYQELDRFIKENKNNMDNIMSF